jgi:hypothetical protein
MVPLWVRLAERRMTHLLRKLAWLSVFLVARKSLIYWMDGLK